MTPDEAKAMEAEYRQYIRDQVRQWTENEKEMEKLRAESSSLRQGVERLFKALATYAHPEGPDDCPCCDCSACAALRETEGLVTGPYFTKEAQSKIAPGQVEQSKITDAEGLVKP